MKKGRKLFMAVAALTAVVALAGCKEEVVTVADIQNDEEQTVEYIEMQQFELKEAEKESGREEILHCAVLIPEGYFESEEIKGMYLHEKAPLDSSNVYFSVAEGMEGAVSGNLTEQEYEKVIALTAKYADQIIEITDYTI